MIKDNSKQQNSFVPFQGLIYYPMVTDLALMHMLYIQTCQSMLNNKEQTDLKPKVKEEYDSESINKEFEEESVEDACKKRIVKINPYIWPGTTKNYYKNVGKKLASFIINSFDQPQVKQDPFIIQFTKQENQNYNRKHFQKLFKSKIAKRIATNFFGNFQWCTQFVSQNKTEIAFYLRHNKQIYKRKKREQSIQKK